MSTYEKLFFYKLSTEIYSKQHRQTDRQTDRQTEETKIQTQLYTFQTCHRSEVKQLNVKNKLP